MIDDTPRIVSVHLETECAARPETVWGALVEDIDDWWGEPYVSSPERVALTLDARPGGQLFEDWGNGNGTAWATVRALRRPRQLEFDGTFMMAGALHGTVTITIEPTDDTTTRIVLVQQAIGAISDETTATWHSGWSDLLAALTAHSTNVEGTQP